MDSLELDERPAERYVTLRWLAVIPGAIAAGWLGWFVVVLLNRLTFSLQYMNPDSFLGRAFIDAVSSAIMGIASVYAGARIAPSHRREVVFGLAGLTLLGVGFLLFPAIKLGSGWAIYSAIWWVGGAAGIAYAFYAESQRSPVPGQAQSLEYVSPAPRQHDYPSVPSARLLSVFGPPQAFSNRPERKLATLLPFLGWPIGAAGSLQASARSSRVTIYLTQGESFAAHTSSYVAGDAKQAAAFFNTLRDAEKWLLTSCPDEQVVSTAVARAEATLNAAGWPAA